MTYLGAGVLVAAVVVVAVVLLVRRSVTTGALGQYVAPYAERSTEPSAGGVELVGGGVWTWGVRASPPLVRLYVGPDDVRIGPSSPGWSFLIPSLVVPRADLISVAEVERPFGRRGVRFSVPGASFAFIGEVDAVLGAVAAHPPPASSLG